MFETEISTQGALETLHGKPVLFVGDGGRGYVYAVILSGMFGKSTPAGADFDYPVAGFKLEFLAYAIILGDRGIFQGVL